MTVSGQVNGKAVYWSHNLTKADMDLITKPVVDRIVMALQQALVEVCFCIKCVKINTTQFQGIAEAEKAKMRIYYQLFLDSPKYLLVSGGPARMASVCKGIEQLLVC